MKTEKTHVEYKCDWCGAEIAHPTNNVSLVHSWASQDGANRQYVSLGGPIYLCDICGEYEAVTVAYGVGVCSEECAERAEVDFLRDMAKFSKDLFERILENGLDEGTEKEMKGIIRCIDDWVK